MAITIGMIFILLVLPVGAIFLQIFLSKRSSRWLGLILPTICALNALLLTVGKFSYSEADGMLLFKLLVAFLLSNIPTLVLLGIYAACREKLRANAGLHKMNIQDLE